MRVLVCGDRNWADQVLVDNTLDDIHQNTPITLVIEGEARGADKAGRFWAESRNIPFAPYPANWEKYGRAAGPIRNRQQFNEGKPDLVIAFHDNLAESKGTADMVRYAESKKCKVLKVKHAL